VLLALVVLELLDVELEVLGPQVVLVGEARLGAGAQILLAARIDSRSSSRRSSFSAAYASSASSTFERSESRSVSRASSSTHVTIDAAK